MTPPPPSARDLQGCASWVGLPMINWRPLSPDLRQRRPANLLPMVCDMAFRRQTEPYTQLHKPWNILPYAKLYQAPTRRSLMTTLGAAQLAVRANRKAGDEIDAASNIAPTPAVRSTACPATRNFRTRNTCGRLSRGQILRGRIRGRQILRGRIRGRQILHGRLRGRQILHGR